MGHPSDIDAAYAAAYGRAAARCAADAAEAQAAYERAVAVEQGTHGPGGAARATATEEARWAVEAAEAVARAAACGAALATDRAEEGT